MIIKFGGFFLIEKNESFFPTDSVGTVYHRAQNS